MGDEWTRWLGMTVVGATLLAGTGCRPTTESKPSSGYTIATVVKVDGIDWFEQMRDGGKRFGRETGHDCFLVGPA